MNQYPLQPIHSPKFLRNKNLGGQAYSLAKIFAEQKLRRAGLQPARGFGIIEIVVAITVITLSLFAITSVANSAVSFNGRVFLSTQAGFLLEEGSEGLRMTRDSNWSNISTISTGAAYYLYFSTSTPNSWKATTTKSLIGGVFDRTFSVNDVYRDGDDRISPSGTLDPNTKKIDMTVSWWNGKATSTKAVIFYLTNLFN